MAQIASAASTYTVRSPDGRVEIRIQTGERITYSIYLRSKVLVQDATMSLRVDEATLGRQPTVRDTKQQTVDQEILPVVRQKFARLREHYNELRLEMQEGYSVVFRAYNEGAAYRFETSLPRAEVKIYSEEVVVNFAGDYSAYYPQEESFISHNEREFKHVALKSITSSAIASLPAVVDFGDGTKMALAEADVDDYPGLWLQGTSGNTLAGTFPAYPLKEKLERDRDLKVVERADYLAGTRGTRTFPWRIFGIAEKDGDLLTNQLVYLLAKPSQLQDTAWIKPGKVAWDWWNANNIYGVDFKSGVNTQTYKYYIDFASKYGIEYIILDEGWYKLGNVLQVVPEMDIAELMAYGRRKNVGIILWVVWKTLADQLEPALDQFEKWGAKGIKVDFMQRDDQPLMKFYDRICREAAKRRLLVDFHGAIRPAIMTRTWPNLISTEGVKGLEHNKWSKDITPEHNVTLPFTRMFLGPMDYTPGAMLNAGKNGFASVFERPMSQGTRCHQLAMYVIFESPLQMLADSPSNYLKEAETMEFLSRVPSVWDETRVLDARIGDYVVVARRNGSDWYLGAMTDWTSRDFEIDFSFLPAGFFQMDSYQDGANAARFGNDYRKTSSQVDRTAKIKIQLAEGGGWAAIVHPVKRNRMG